MVLLTSHIELDHDLVDRLAGTQVGELRLWVDRAEQLRAALAVGLQRDLRDPGLLCGGQAKRSRLPTAPSSPGLTDGSFSAPDVLSNDASL